MGECGIILTLMIARNDLGRESRHGCEYHDIGEVLSALHIQCLFMETPCDHNTNRAQQDAR